MTTLSEQFNELVKETLTDNKNDIQPEIMDESTKCRDFIHDNNSSNKPECKYTTARVKSITFLWNISYVGINKEDFYNENFIFDVYLLVTKNLNPFSLHGKVNNQNEHQMIYMLCNVFRSAFTSMVARIKTFFILMVKMFFNQKYQKL